jgi:hypothetical protein
MEEGRRRCDSAKIFDKEALFVRSDMSGKDTNVFQIDQSPMRVIHASSPQFESAFADRRR